MAISMAQIKAQIGKEVEIPGWDDSLVTFKLRRPSMLALAAGGHIPNGLLNAAQQLFFSEKVTGENSLVAMYDVLRTIVKASMVEPTLDALEAEGIELTDEQLVAIFQYSQSGTAALARFRPDEPVSEGDSSGEADSENAIASDEN